MPTLRDFLRRWRPAVAPGAAARTGVPADRPAGSAEELMAVFRERSTRRRIGAGSVPVRASSGPSTRSSARDSATVQAYEYTGGLAPGDPAEAYGEPLSAPLGPHLLGGVFDGLLRPLTDAGTGLTAVRSAPRPKEWRFTPAVPQGHDLGAGEPVGTVEEAGTVPYAVLTPVPGRVTAIRPPGRCGPDVPVASVGDRDITLCRRRPVRSPAPYRERLEELVPLVTGQRVVDLLLPVPYGGAAAVPGGFGTGKTVLLQQIAEWCDADVVVYVGCGERGNEMAWPTPGTIPPCRGRPRSPGTRTPSPAGTPGTGFPAGVSAAGGWRPYSPRPTGSACWPSSSEPSPCPRERVALLAGRMLREGVLRQSALSAVDAFSAPERTAALTDGILAAIAECEAMAARGVPGRGDRGTRLLSSAAGQGAAGRARRRGAGLRRC
jgi:ATP synthase alpha/beta family, nucleotide-binding domain/ATPsynthase alpha/beta subunit N-term extension